MATAMDPTKARRVLIVEDDPSVRRGLARLFRRLGWEASEAANGQDGLERITEEAPQVIVLDLEMPVLDGSGFMAVMQADPTLAAIPVIRISGRKWTNPGPHFLAKPFAPNALCSLLGTLGFPTRN